MTSPAWRNNKVKVNTFTYSSVFLLGWNSVAVRMRDAEHDALAAHNVSVCNFAVLRHPGSLRRDYGILFARNFLLTFQWALPHFTIVIYHSRTIDDISFFVFPVHRINRFFSVKSLSVLLTVVNQTDFQCSETGTIQEKSGTRKPLQRF